jgi:hypothetical protein
MISVVQLVAHVFSVMGFGDMSFAPLRSINCVPMVSKCRILFQKSPTIEQAKRIFSRGIAIMSGIPIPGVSP